MQSAQEAASSQWIAGSDHRLDDYAINPSAALTTGYADAWTFGRASGWQRSLYGDGIADLNTSGYTYAAGRIAGTATFAYVAAPVATAGYGYTAGFAGVGTANCRHQCKNVAPVGRKVWRL